MERPLHFFLYVRIHLKRIAYPRTTIYTNMYKFTCANCNVSYVGETCRHLDVRIEEHFKSASSHIHKHLSNQHACKAACDKSCFQIIDSATSSFRLKIKEAIHINWDKPELNKQMRHTVVSIVALYLLFLFKLFIYNSFI